MNNNPMMNNNQMMNIAQMMNNNSNMINNNMMNNNQMMNITQMMNNNNNMMNNNMNQMMMPNMQNLMMENILKNQMMFDQTNQNNQMMQMNQMANMFSQLIKMNNQINPQPGSNISNNNQEGEKMNIVFRVSGKRGQNKAPKMIQCLPDEKVSEVVQRYRDQTGDYDKSKKFIYNAKSLNFELTVKQHGITNNGNIFVITTKGIKGAN